MPLSRWRVVIIGHASILKIDSVAPLDINYLRMEYCFDKGFNFLISSRTDWTPDTVVPPELLDVYTDGFKLDGGVGSRIYPGRLALNIRHYIALLDYCSLL